MPTVGGLGQKKPANETVKGLLEKLSEEIKLKVSEKNPVHNPASLSLTAVEFKSQIVAGTNYFIKIQITENDFVHARIYQPLQGNATLHSVTDTKTSIDEIEYF